MENQLLIFDTTERTVSVSVQRGYGERKEVLFSFTNIITVKIYEGYYEVMQKLEESLSVVPVLRLPISNTNMLIKK